MTPDLDIAVRFLLAIRPRGPWTISAIFPDGKGAPTETFLGESEVDRMRAWIERYNAHAGVYFCANPTRRRMHKRPSEKDIWAFQYVVLDFDPEPDESPPDCEKRIRRMLKRFKLQPTFVWRSGNGMQAMWRLRKAVILNSKATIRECKLVNLGMVQALKSDSTQSLEHLFRIPGTINYPNRVKRSLGRKPIRAGDFTHNREARYDPSQFPEPVKKHHAKSSRGLVEPPGGWDTSAGVNDAVRYFQNTHDLAEEGKSGTAIRTARRSRDYGVSEELTHELMWEHWVPRCEYDWEEEELRSKVQRAFAGAVNDPGCRTIEYRFLCAKDDFNEEAG